MTILDKLLEKKDILSYIDYRIEHLNNEMKNEILRQEESKRESIKQRFMGRIYELHELEKLIRQNKIKSMSKKYFKKLNKGDEVNEI